MGATFAEALRRWNRDCTGREPSMSLLQKGADDAADLIDELYDALNRIMLNGDLYDHETCRLAYAALVKSRREDWDETPPQEPVVLRTINMSCPIEDLRK